MEYTNASKTMVIGANEIQKQIRKGNLKTYLNASKINKGGTFKKTKS